jgi:hypothetical protein
MELGLKIGCDDYDKGKSYFLAQKSKFWPPRGSSRSFYHNQIITLPRMTRFTDFIMLFERLYDDFKGILAPEDIECMMLPTSSKFHGTGSSLAAGHHLPMIDSDSEILFMLPTHLCTQASDCNTFQTRPTRNYFLFSALRTVLDTVMPLLCFSSYLESSSMFSLSTLVFIVAVGASTGTSSSSETLACMLLR